MTAEKQSEVEQVKKLCKMIKQISVLLGLAAVLLPFPVFAQESTGRIHIEQLDTETKDPVSGVSLSLYKIAAEESGNYELTEMFRETGIDPDKFREKEEYNHNVQILDQFIETHRVTAEECKVSGNDGTVDYTGLEDGIYFIKQTNTQEDYERLGYSYETDSYLVILPWTDENGNLTREVNCKPKGKKSYPEETKDLIVYKIWKDENDKAKKRPVSICVGLYREDKLQEKVTLDAANNWTYQWKNLSVKDNWKIEEIDVPSGYVSETSVEGNAYIITNSLKKEKKILVKTGDPANLITNGVLLIGALLAITGVWIYKKRLKI